MSTTRLISNAHNSSCADFMVQDSISPGVCEIISDASKCGAMSSKQRTPLTPEQRDESSRLKAIYESRKAVARDAGGRLTQDDVAEACGWSNQSAVSQYMNGKIALNLDALLKFARALDFSPEEVSPRLAKQISDYDYPAPQTITNVRSGPEFFRHVPEISWVQAGCWTEVEEFSLDLSDVPYWPCPVACSDQTFALRVEGDSMAPHFPQGMLIFVDPEVMPVSGKKVVALLTDTNQATFKQYIEDGGQKMLKAMNPNWPQQYIPINGKCRIVGTVVFAGMEV